MRREKEKERKLEGGYLVRVLMMMGPVLTMTMINSESMRNSLLG